MSSHLSKVAIKNNDVAHDGLRSALHRVQKDMGVDEPKKANAVKKSSNPYKIWATYKRYPGQRPFGFRDLALDGA
ncbi:hypothetical protein GQX73_g2910 [Xylaria multiplex]|uniref:Uncharacterized protein n=1 Tax=Xylaria multiplex TaxID=323545 RepID=A0A7C8MPX6_9PEZI|nr:hypothetical protein GQX73_g2910 [Xylaria multiplex]